MKNMARYILVVCTVFTTHAAYSISTYLNPATINFTSPTTNDFIVADITGNYATPGFLLNGAPVVDVSNGNINIIFNVDSPTGPVPQVLEPFNYAIDIGLLTAGDWYVTPVFYVDGVFDSTYLSTAPLFTVTAVPVPAAIWLFGSGLIGLLGLSKRNRK